MSRLPRALASGRLLQLFSTTILDQVVLSAANFFVGFMLIRRTSDVDYGLFVLVQSAIQLVVSAQNAWISGPLAVLAPKRPEDVRRVMIGAIGASQRRIVRFSVIVTMCVPVAGYWLGYYQGLVAAAATLGVFACGAALQREYLRNVLLIYSRANSLLIADLFYVGALAAGAVMAAYGPPPAVLWAIGGLVLAAWLCCISAHRSLVDNPGFVAGHAAPFWREMRPLGIWSLVGAIIYWSFGQSYSYMLASRIDLKAVADVNAARLLLMPTFVISMGIKSLLFPSAASWLAESGLAKLTKRLLLFAAGVVALDLVYFAVVWTFRDWLTGDFFHKTIADRDMLLILWGCVALLSVVRDILLCALLALEHFKPMAWLTALSAIVSLSLMWYGLAIWGPRAALIGQISGEIVSLIGVTYFLASQLTKARRRPEG